MLAPSTPSQKQLFAVKLSKQKQKKILGVVGWLNSLFYVLPTPVNNELVSKVLQLISK
jgi:hypothetical protein